MRECEVRDLGRAAYGPVWDMQKRLADDRKAGRIPDQLLFVEHPHVVTMGRNGREDNLLAPPDLLARAGIAYYEIDRGGDVTYHGPGQVVAYPIFDLREWKRDVGAYVRGLEQVIIEVLAEFGIAAGREKGAPGVWVDGAKICAIGVHLSRWVSSHGLAFNLATDLSYFRYIIPCGLTKPVTSLRQLGVEAIREQILARMVEHFGQIFEMRMSWPPPLTPAEPEPLETSA